MENLNHLCEKYKVKNKVNPTRLTEYRERFFELGPFMPIVEAHIVWRLDHNFRTISSLSLLNWLKNQKRFQKERELKRLTKKADKARLNIKNYPAWEPPN